MSSTQTLCTNIECNNVSGRVYSMNGATRCNKCTKRVRVAIVRQHELDLINFCNRHCPNNEAVRDKLQILINVSQRFRVNIESPVITNTADKLIEDYKKPHFDFNPQDIQESMSRPDRPQELIETDSPIICLPNKKRKEPVEEEIKYEDVLLDSFVFNSACTDGMELGSNYQVYRDGDRNVFMCSTTRLDSDRNTLRGKRIIRARSKVAHIKQPRIN